MKINYLLSIFAIIAFFLINQPLKGQRSIPKNTVSKKSALGAKVKWTANPFDYQVFIENKGQFSGTPNGDKILYGAQVGNVYVFITPHGLIYKYTERPEDADKKHSGAVDPDEIDLNKKPIDHYLTATWQGSTGNIATVAGEEQTYYYTYPGADNKSTIKVNVFKTITCQNVYPGIDVKYTFLEGKDGFKYMLIVHPGADLSSIKLKYKGAKEMKADPDGKIEINSGWGQFVDHTPTSYYEENNNSVDCSYQLNNYTESFTVKNVDATKTLIIDPWSTNWTSKYTGTGGAYDLDYDYAGNVYVYGGTFPYQLAKYNNVGAQQWTYITSNFPNSPYGAFCVDKTSGSCFCFEGFGFNGYAYVDKLSRSGTLISTLTSGTMNEQWRATYDICSHSIAIGGGGIFTSLQAATLDTNNVKYDTLNILGLPPGNPVHDIGLIGSDPIVDSTYMATVRSFLFPLVDDNLLLRMPMPSLSPTALLTNDGFAFLEVYGMRYIRGTNGMNGMALSPNWVYLYDGATLRQENKNTGAIHNSTNVSPTNFEWGGISVDLCDDIYLGDSNNIDLYNASLIYTGTIGSFPGNVYDVVLGNGRLASDDTTLYVCGQGFVSSIHIAPPGPPLIVKKRTRVCACNCTATGTLTLCGNADTSSNVSYLWSNGQTNHTATNLCPGNTYTLTIKLGCSKQFQDTFNMPPSGTLSIIKTQTSANCDTGGTASVITSGGASPYTYLWSNGATTSNIGGLGTGNYCVTITDKAGCQDSVCFIIPGSTIPKIIIAPSSDSLCLGDTSILTASGATKYSWSPPGGLSCTNCQNPTAKPITTTTYIVTGTNASGCSSTAFVTVYVKDPPTIHAITSQSSICEGESVTLVASATNNTSPFTWQPGAITGPTITVTPTVTTTYTVTASNVCGTTSIPININVNQLPIAKFDASVTNGCSPLCIQFLDETLSQDRIVQWRWKFGNGDTLNSESPIYCYPKPGDYEVKLTTITDSGCSSTLSVPNYIKVYSPPAGSFIASPQPTTILEPTIQFADKSTDAYGILFWIWNFGEQGDTISNLQNPTHVYRDTGTYCPSLIVVDLHGCMDTVINCVVIDPIFTLYIPSAFTPNGDKRNEVFMAKGNDIKSFEMYVFDRWGMELFHSTNINEGWDGTFKGFFCQEDIYIYKITVTDSQDNQHSYIGNITLIK